MSPPPPPPPLAPAPSLPVELLEEIFLRLPPDEPEWLVLASLASKYWLGLLTGHRFRGLYREFHGSSPMLGFIYNRPYNLSQFVSTTKFRARIPDDLDFDWDYNSVWDCRHGRVLLVDTNYTTQPILLWDPMTDCRKGVDVPFITTSVWGAVLCAVSGCDHRMCHEGPFRVVVVGADNFGSGWIAYEGVSSPETEGLEWTNTGLEWANAGLEWTNTCNGLDNLANDGDIVPLPPVLIDDALHFLFVSEDDNHVGIIKYNLGLKCLSLIDAPLAEAKIAGDVILIAMGDGSLGFAHVDGLTLNLWSRQMGSDGVAAWIEAIIIDLNKLLPIHNQLNKLRLIGSVEGCDIIFVATDFGIYEVNVKSLHQKKICEREKYCALFPYMSFYSQPETELVRKNKERCPSARLAGAMA